MSGPCSILILGAGSDIGAALADAAAQAGHALILAAREPAALSALAGTLRARGVAVEVRPFDAVDTGKHADFVDRLPYLPEIAVCMTGLLGQGAPAGQSGAQINLSIDVNLTGPISILNVIAARMEARGHGALVGIGSVAGDRGRATNYIYGAAKAGLTAFLSGLRQRLAKANVRVVTIKLGPVRTKMTAHMAGARFADPKVLAPSLLQACLNGSGEIYLPRHWRVIMLVIRAIPDWLFVRLRQF